MKQFSLIKTESPVKAKKIEVTVEVALLVIVFFIWLGIGMYVSVPENTRGSLLPMFLMYLVFPVLIALFSVQRVRTILSSEEPDEETKEEEKPENDTEK